MARLNKYIVNVTVLRATGHQSWCAHAESEQSAIEAWKNGEGTCIQEEFEGQDYGKPTVTKVLEV